VTPATIRALYNRALTEFEVVQFRRYSGVGVSRTPADYPVRARVVEYRPEELVGGIVQGDVRLIVLAEDVEQTGFVVPLVATADKIVIRGRELSVKSVDDNTRRVGGQLMAYDIRVGG